MVGVLLAARLIPDVASVHHVLVVIGSIVVVGFLLLPLLFGVDDTLDPRAFSLFGIPNRQLSTGLALAALIGIPSVVLTVLLAGHSRHLVARPGHDPARARLGSARRADLHPRARA